MDNLYDVVIIGGGPAGLTAALYLARAKYRVLVLEKEQFGGQIAITHEVVNYPGLAKTGGKELTDTIQQQAESFGAEFMLAEATGFDVSEDIKAVHTNRGDFRCFGILLATGAHPRTVGFQGEEEYKGRGVAYCATCDGEFFTGKEIFVVGGGYAAAEESVFLTKFARHVTILIRNDDFSCAASVADQAKMHEKITVLTNTVMEEVSGANGLTYARYKNTVTGEVTEYRSEDSFGVFVFVGYAPATEIVRGTVELNEQGYIITDGSQKTSAEGIYAAGDVCIKPLRQVVTATGDGALAATELEKYVAAMQRKTGLRADVPVPKQSKPKAAADTQGSSTSEELFTAEMRRQLDTVFSRMEKTLLLRLYLDNRPISAELEGFITSLTALSDKLHPEVYDRQADESFAPCVEVCFADGTPTGLAFHGVPGGHEFTSFVLGLYNAAGPGQDMDPDIREMIAGITQKTDIKILVTLSCTMCPDLVAATQKIAASNPNVCAHVYDIHHFEDLKNRHKVMSVPCLVVNDETVSFGKKNIRQVLELIRG
ncbi:MAG: FAD-dependent oxidoreductase [Ruminococcaceae bacterium]|nr:FAD-dependent oxidoreductase [Oscillospiraceae bacterium]MBQ3064910.1 FAD-dependent oxidoreductase [Clostridia bacterium]